MSQYFNWHVPVFWCMKKNPMYYATQFEVATEAGVSRSTVQAVLSDSPIRISAQVREHVKKAAARLNYRPNRYAKAMRNGKTGLIGLIDFGRLRHLSYRKIQVAAEKIIRSQYEPLVMETLWLPQNDDGGGALCRRIIDSRVEGVVLVHPQISMFSPRSLEQLRQVGIEVVSIGGGEYLHGISCFHSDRQWGYHAMARHLLNLGYRRLALLADQSPFPRRGIEQAVAEHGEGAEVRFFSPSEVPEASPLTRDYLRGKTGMEEILAENARPDAVICGNDEWAQGALTACTEAGLQVPQDLALTGFDDDPSSAFGTLPLTTVAQPIAQISDQAVQCLLALIREKRAPEPRRVDFRGQLIVRHSCGAFLRTA